MLIIANVQILDWWFKVQKLPRCSPLTSFYFTFDDYFLTKKKVVRTITGEQLCPQLPKLTCEKPLDQG